MTTVNPLYIPITFVQASLIKVRFSSLLCSVCCEVTSQAASGSLCYTPARVRKVGSGLEAFGDTFVTAERLRRLGPPGSPATLGEQCV